MPSCEHQPTGTAFCFGGQLWASFVTALPFWNRRLTGWFGNRDYTRGLCAVVLLTCALQCGMWFHPTEYRRNSAYEAERQAMEGIPRQATVLAPDNLLAALSDRAGINSLTALRVYGQNQRRVLEYDYIIFDGNYSTAAEVLPVEQRLFDINQDRRELPPRIRARQRLHVPANPQMTSRMRGVARMMSCGIPYHCGKRSQGLSRNFVSGWGEHATVIGQKLKPES